MVDPPFSLWAWLKPLVKLSVCIWVLFVGMTAATGQTVCVFGAIFVQCFFNWVEAYIWWLYYYYQLIAAESFSFPFFLWVPCAQDMFAIGCLSFWLCEAAIWVGRTVVAPVPYNCCVCRLSWWPVKCGYAHIQVYSRMVQEMKYGCPVFLTSMLNWSVVLLYKTR